LESPRDTKQEAETVETIIARRMVNFTKEVGVRATPA
jgi:hypothetical protein